MRGTFQSDRRSERSAVCCSLCVASAAQPRRRVAQLRAGHAHRVDRAPARFKASFRTRRVAPVAGATVSGARHLRPRSRSRDRSGRFEMRTLSPGPYLLPRASQRFRRVARSGRRRASERRLSRRRSRFATLRSRHVVSAAGRGSATAHRLIPPPVQPTDDSATTHDNDRRRSRRSWRGGCVTRGAAS